MSKGTLETLQSDLQQFVKDRDWGQFHAPKNLSMAISAEAGELLALLQWLPEDDTDALDDPLRKRVVEEIADVFLYLLLIAQRLDIDLIEAASAKLVENGKKYPAELVRGSARKYNEY